MPYAVGDKVVHPYHGPGWISSVTNRELLDGTKRYYVIEVPGQNLTVTMPVSQADEAGLRPAMPESRLPRVLSELRAQPGELPEYFRERQEHVGAQIRTREVMQLARVVRDLTWRREQKHLTKTDADSLRQGRDLLAAEMALVSGESIAQASSLIEATVSAAVAHRLNLASPDVPGMG